MAVREFGNPVTEMTLKNMWEFSGGKKITQFDLARIAQCMTNAENKAVYARDYADNLKLSHGTAVCTKCLIYNATGEAITLVGSRNFYGVGIGQPPYPTQIANGQWAAFLHTNSNSAVSGSSGALLYRIKGVNGPDDDVDCMIAWCTAGGPWNSNHSYAEIREKGHFGDTVWGAVETNMGNSNLRCVETVGYFRAEVVNKRTDTITEWEAILKVGNP